MPTISADNAYHIDLGPDPDFTGGSFVSFKPEQLACDDMVRGVGNCSWQISFSAKDEDNATIVIPPAPPEYVPFIGPYRDYFRLRYGNVAIVAGPIVSTETKIGDDFVSVSGKTWEHYLERWQYPFDPRVTPSDPVDHTQDYQFPNSLMNNEGGPGSGQPLAGTGLAYECYQRDIVLIISDILSQTMNAVPYRHIFDLSNFASGLSGIHANYQLSLGDQTYMDALIGQLADIGQGLDWWITHYGKFYWASPFRFGNPATPTLALTVDSTTPLGVGALGFGNNGPVATHVFGKGAGFATQTTMARAYGYGPAQAKYSRLDKMYDFGDFRHKQALTDRTERQLSLDLQPQHTIPLQLDPSQIPNFWSTIRKGRAIWITYDLGSNYIDSLHQIVSWSARDENNSGNMLVDLTLQQRYDLDWSVGTAEG